MMTAAAKDVQIERGKDWYSDDDDQARACPAVKSYYAYNRPRRTE
jgi:hypothetical protein